MKHFEIIQGGMGVAISNWELARAVATQGGLGVVSGTGIHLVMTARLMDGDLNGDVRRALSHFPYQASVQRTLDKYYITNPTTPPATYKRPPMWTLKPAKELTEITIQAAFAEVFLAKEGHQNQVGINLLEKIQMPTMASLYGAMLADVDVVIMGAGIPLQVPGILDKLANHEAVSYRIDVQGGDGGDECHMHFDPKKFFESDRAMMEPLTRPFFLPIVSSVVLAKSLIRRSTGKVNGFIVEGHTAGGHNAPPRGKMRLDEAGEPIFGEKDAPDIEKIKQLGLPFWLAGGYDSPEMLIEARAAGAAGVQIGTAFAFCQESGMEDSVKRRVIQKVTGEGIEVRTDPQVSPTKYPFKVVQLENTMSDPEIANMRVRLCDIGLLREPYLREDNKIGFRCSAEPEDQYLKKGGESSELAGKGCLCNNLCASAGFPQHRSNGFVEQPLVTSGNSLPYIGKFLKQGSSTYSAKDVLNFITGAS